MAALAGAGLMLWLGAVDVPGVAAAGAESAPKAGRAPRLWPDYTGVVIPPNIAPLNFKVQEPGARYRVEIYSARGERIALASRSPSIRIPAEKWKALLRANAGQWLCLEVSVQDSQDQWKRFEAVTNSIAREEIDRCLVYRLLQPLYSLYVNLGLYQRDLESFAERAVLENGKIDKNCLNCHTPLNHRADTFAFHTRSSQKLQPMILVLSNQVARVDKTMGYLSWHPSGRLLAFSANKLNLFYHTRGETRDVFDARSNLGIYRMDSNTVVVPPALALPDRNETWPSWSPDGRYLYYCSAPRLAVEQFRQVRYDLMRISYDLDRDQWGEPEMLLSTQQSGLSAAQPRVSPDGRCLLFCLSRYGNFPIYQPSSDLYAMDLSTRQCRRLGINSDQADTWHCWSSNGRWVVFSSKRLDGLFARPFFSYVDDQGQFYKPFLLPQADPAFYDSFPKTFNVPELVQGPITVQESDLARAVLKPLKVLSPKGETRPPAPDQPAATGASEAQEGYRQAPK
ncbi:MAG: cytochrome C biosynthesis protein [Verrucomicrobiota bacterium]